MTGGILAAVTLDPRGGGIAAVSRLLWRVFRDQWPDAARVVTLLDDHQTLTSLDSTKTMRLRFGARLAKAQMTGEPAFVLYSHLSLAQVQTYIPATLRRPYAIFLHGIEAWRPLSRAQRIAVEGAALLLSNSQYTATRVAQAHPWIGPIAPCPLAMCPVGTLEPSSSKGQRTDAVVGPHAVLIVARMSSKERYKGHDQLLEAWPAVVAKIADAQLILAGEGDDTERLQTKAASLGIERHVVFTGFVSDETLQTLYERAALFAMPSRDEGFGLVYLEAMSHRLACLGSPHDAASETIEDGVTGLLRPQNDIPGLAGAIVQLLADDALRRELGRRGYERLQRTFTYPLFRERLASLLVTNTDRLASLAIPAGSNR